MKRSWAAFIVALAAFGAGAGCNDYGNTFQNNTGAVLSFLSPSQVAACVPATGVTCSDLTLTVNGAGFVLKTYVQWNGKKLATTVPTDSTGAALGNVVTAVVPAAMLSAPGTAAVLTVNPASGTGQNGLSQTITFIINNPPNPVPVVSSVSPVCAAPGTALALTVNGSNFLSGSGSNLQVSTLNWNLGGVPSSFTAPAATITSTKITATIPAADIATTGTATVTVYNPPSLPLPNIPGSTGSGGGTSTVTAASQVTIQTATCLVAAKGPANSGVTLGVAEETPAVSLDGRYVAYTAAEGEHSQIFLRDTCEGASSGCQARTTLFSATADGLPANADSHAPSMSADGRFIAFSSSATNLVENAPPGRQVYLVDTCVGAQDSCTPTTHLISSDPNGALVGAESILPSVSASGRFVAFLAVTRSHSSSPVSTEPKSPGAANSGYKQVFVRDTCFGATNCTPKTTRISLQPGDDAGAPPAGPALSGNARNVAIAGANAATLFTRSVAVDDRVFLAVANQQR